MFILIIQICYVISLLYNNYSINIIYVFGRCLYGHLTFKNNYLYFQKYDEFRVESEIGEMLKKISIIRNYIKIDTSLMNRW